MSSKKKPNPQTVIDVLSVIRSFAEAMRDPGSITQEQAQQLSAQAFEAKSKILGEVSKR